MNSPQHCHALEGRQEVVKAYLITRHKFYGVIKAIHEFLKERADRWSLKILTIRLFHPVEV